MLKKKSGSLHIFGKLVQNNIRPKTANCDTEYDEQHLFGVSISEYFLYFFVLLNQFTSQFYSFYYSTIQCLNIMPVNVLKKVKNSH